MLCRRRFLTTIAMVLLIGGLVVGCRHVAQDGPGGGRPSPQENRDGGGGGGSGGY